MNRARIRALFASLAIVAMLAVGASGSVAAAGKHHKHHLKLIHPGWLTVGSDTTYPPMEFVNPNKPGTYEGADIDLANAIAKAMGLKGAKIVSTNFATIIPSLQKHDFDVIMSSMNDTAPRRKQIAFVDYMKLNTGESILTLKSGSLHAKGYHGLCGHSVSVETGTIEFDGLTAASKHCPSGKSIAIHGYAHDTDAFQALAADKVQAYTTDLPVALYYVKHHKSVIRFAGKSFGSGGKYGAGFVKSAKALQKAYRKGLKAIQASGKYARILKKWGLGKTSI